MADTLRCWFAKSAGSLLLLTGVAKLLAWFGSAAILALRDPVFGITNRSLMVGVGGLEAAIGLVMLGSRSGQRAYWLAAWCGGNFLLYRVLAKLLHAGAPCPCLGTVTQHLPLSARTVEVLLCCIIAYLIAGSLVCAIVGDSDPGTPAARRSPESSPGQVQSSG